MWDNAAEVLDTFERDDFVRVKGLLQVFQNRPQLTVHKLQPVAGIRSRLRRLSSRPPNAIATKCSRSCRGWIASMTNPHLKALLEAIFADEAVALAYRTAPAAKSVHHAWLGGLIEHVLSLCQLAKFTAAHYPDIDFDLLLAGVILHDIGKIHELTYARGFGYSTEGQLLGHIVIGVRMVEDKLRELPDFPAPLRDLLLHMILSHHGELEFGSPKVPDVRRGDAAASSRQSGFEDGDACAAWSRGTAWSKACGPATAPRSIARVLKKRKYLEASPERREPRFPAAASGAEASEPAPQPTPPLCREASERSAARSEAMRRPAPPRDIPPPLELECLKALWGLGEGTVRDVRQILVGNRNLAYTTVMTVLDRLEKRGGVSRRKNGRSFVFISHSPRRKRCANML